MLEHLGTVWWIFILLGFVGGIISGALGVGSGIVFIPALVILFTVSQKSAQGTALAVMVPMALLGTIRYWRNPQIQMDWEVVGLLIAGAMVGVMIGTEVAARVPGTWLRKAFAVFMIIVAVRMLWPGQTRASPERTPSPPGASESLE